MKYKYTTLKRKLSLMLSLLVLTTSFASPLRFSYAQDQVSKYETVYANLKDDGSERETIISNWLKDSRFEKDVLDKTNAKDIDNVSTDEIPIIKDKNLIWGTQGKDVYYLGKTNEKLPVSTKITYYLDGKEIKPKDLVGKTGKVKIHIKFTNNTTKTQMINGKPKKMSTPFTVAAVMSFDNDKFSDVQGKNTKIFSDGNNQMVMFVGFPGLEESLNIKNTNIEEIRDIDIPSEFTITADAKEFELSSIAIVATPQIPDMLKDIKNVDDIDQMEKDIDVAIKARDTLKEIDPNDTIKNLIKDPKQTDDARVLIDDIFDFYDLDKAIMDILPNYITEENIDLFDRVKANLRDVDINYVLDNKIIRYIPDRMTDSQIDKARVLLDDYDEINTFDMDRYDKALDVINDYNKMQNMIDKSDELYNKIKKHDDELDTLDTLSKYKDRIEDLYDDFKDKSGISGITQDDIEYMIKELVKKKANDYIASNQQIQETIEAGKEQGNKAIQLARENAEKKATEELIANNKDPETEEGQAFIKEKGEMAAEQTKSIVEAQSNQQMENLHNKVESAIQNEMSSQTMDLHNIIVDAQQIQRDIEEDLGYNYESKIREALDFAIDIMPDVRYIRDQEKENEKTVRKALDLATNHNDMEYFKHWANRIKEMKKDMDNNSENIEVMRDLLHVYDDPKIKYFYNQIPKLRIDMDEIRPIANSFSKELDIEKYNVSFHKSPETIRTLDKMRHDLDDMKYIPDAMKLALDDRLVDVARELIEVMDRRDDAGDLDKAKNDLDDLRDMQDRKDKIIDLSDEYTTFSGKEANMKSKVTFIMKTDELEIPEDENKFVPKEEVRLGFFQWLKSLFVDIETGERKGILKWLQNIF